MRTPSSTAIERSCAANDQVVHEFMNAHANLFDYRTPDGGCVSFVRYLGADSAVDFCQRVVEDSGVFLLPSSVYESALGPIPADRFRIGIDRRNVPECLDALADYLTT